MILDGFWTWDFMDWVFALVFLLLFAIGELLWLLKSKTERVADLEKSVLFLNDRLIEYGGNIRPV